MDRLRDRWTALGWAERIWVLGLIGILLVFAVLQAADLRLASALLRAGSATAMVGALAYDRIVASPTAPKPRLLVGTLLVVFLVLSLSGFAESYHELSARDPGAFSEKDISALDGWYFATTVVTTTGFGDITPKSDAARLVVTLQMATQLGVVLAAITRLGQMALLRSPMRGTD